MQTATNIARSHKVDLTELHSALGLRTEELIVKVVPDKSNGHVMIETQEQSAE